MDYLTEILPGPMYSSPYPGYQSSFAPELNNDLDALLARIGQSAGSPLYTQPPPLTLQCVPQLNYNDGQNTAVYQVPEHTPIDAILRQFGIDMHTLQPSGSTNNYFKTGYQPIELSHSSSFLPAPISYPASPRRRRMVCQEISDTDDDDHRRYLPNRDHRDHRDHRDRDYRNDRIPAPLPSRQPPANLHNLLSRVWSGALDATDRLPAQSSAPDLRPSWRDTRNAPPYMSRDQRNAVNNNWQRANQASRLNPDRYSPVFDRMGHPLDPIMPPPRQNFGLPQNNFASRNAPPSMNLGLQGSPPSMMNLGRDSFGLSNPLPPLDAFQGGPNSISPPSSLAGLLSQAYRQRLAFPRAV